MSKQILIIDLSDDAKCYGCKRLALGNAKYICAENSRVVENESGCPARTSDCPLIPVDDIMRAIDGCRWIGYEKYPTKAMYRNHALGDAEEAVQRVLKHMEGEK